ncbi:hypothetical protein CDAR_396971 [Caerostris darwini]|uniref:Uncharacterized protein n=1 Tax=Caerostris darwini TaxID=1538125 RepID=A0AAV4Q7X5_9ARAC|nr:hypothetical protein CDAR_396971 [Caerostris darwini]
MFYTATFQWSLLVKNHKTDENLLVDSKRNFGIGGCRPPPNDSRVNWAIMSGEMNTARDGPLNRSFTKQETPSTVAMKNRNSFSWKRSSAKSKRLSSCLQ